MQKQQHSMYVRHGLTKCSLSIRVFSVSAGINRAVSEETGVVIHMKLAKVSNKPGKKQFVEKIGNYTVLTTSMNYASARALVVKRLMDIAGGLAGCLLTALVFVIVAPILYQLSRSNLLLPGAGRKEWKTV